MDEKSMATQKKRSGSLRSIFLHADGVDMLLMTLGFLGAVGDGASMPVLLQVTGKIMNNIGGTSSVADAFSHSINKVPFSPYNICRNLYVFVRLCKFCLLCLVSWLTECSVYVLCGLWAMGHLFPWWVLG